MQDPQPEKTFKLKYSLQAKRALVRHTLLKLITNSSLLIYQI
jgi:hypothetical protein